MTTFRNGHPSTQVASYWMTLGSGDVRTAERVIVTPARPDLHHDGRTSCRRLSPTISYPRSIWPSAIAIPVQAPTLKPTDPCRPLARLAACRTASHAASLTASIRSVMNWWRGEVVASNERNKRGLDATYEPPAALIQATVDSPREGTNTPSQCTAYEYLAINPKSANLVALNVRQRPIKA
jgi:hypothetical protein